MRMYVRKDSIEFHKEGKVGKEFLIILYLENYNATDRHSSCGLIEAYTILVSWCQGLIRSMGHEAVYFIIKIEA